MQHKITLKIMKIQCVLKRDLEFGGWLCNGKVLAPNASIVSYRNLLKYLFIKIVCLIKNSLFGQNGYGRDFEDTTT